MVTGKCFRLASAVLSAGIAKMDNSMLEHLANKKLSYRLRHYNSSYGVRQQVIVLSAQKGCLNRHQFCLLLIYFAQLNGDLSKILFRTYFEYDYNVLLFIF